MRRDEEYCCQGWGEIIHHFEWFHFAKTTGPELRMPSLRGGGKDWPVNFCPVCGASRRNAVEYPGSPEKCAMGMEGGN